MNKTFISSLVITVAALAVAAVPVFAAPPTSKGKPSTGGGGKTTTPLGIDVSWPQCGSKLPNDFAFAIVGINNGRASGANPCLAAQLDWAQQAKGGTVQPPVQVYVNTANPVDYIGQPELASWPTDNSALVGTVITENPYGECKGDGSLGCVWMYGFERARDAVTDYFATAVSQTTKEVNSNAADYVWWLDVELDNTWELGGTSADFESNIASLEGMTAYYQQVVGAKVGIYAYGPQWTQIVGNAAKDGSNLNDLPNWRPGGAGLATATQACSADPLTTGGDVVLTQFVKKGIDYNYSCNG